MPDFNTSNVFENVRELFQLLPIEGFDSHSERSYERLGFRNLTDQNWAQTPPTLPFTISEKALRGNESKLPNSILAKIPEGKREIFSRIISPKLELDAIGAIAMTIPLLDNQTLLHEQGCWNGNNLLHLVLFAHLCQKFPSYTIGTDINCPALNMARFAAEEVGLNSAISFYFAHALDQLNFRTIGLSFEKQIQVLLRLMPVLSIDDGKQLLSNIKQHMTSDCHIILSYSNPDGEIFDKLTKKSASDVQINRDELGTTIWQRVPNLANSIVFPDDSIVIATFYSNKQFETLSQICGLKITDLIALPSENGIVRTVVTLARK